MISTSFKVPPDNIIKIAVQTSSWCVAGRVGSFVDQTVLSLLSYDVGLSAS